MSLTSRCILLAIVLLAHRQLITISVVLEHLELLDPLLFALGLLLMLLSLRLRLEPSNPTTLSALLGVCLRLSMQSLTALLSLYPIFNIALL
jgi:hypothetical protein